MNDGIPVEGKDMITIPVDCGSIKAHGKVTMLSAVKVFSLPNGRMLVGLVNYKGRQVAGGLILAASELDQIAKAVADLQAKATVHDKPLICLVHPYKK
jgi:hypothetical protein